MNRNLLSFLMALLLFTALTIIKVYYNKFYIADVYIADILIATIVFLFYKSLFYEKYMVTFILTLMTVSTICLTSFAVNYLRGLKNIPVISLYLDHYMHTKIFISLLLGIVILSALDVYIFERDNYKFSYMYIFLNIIVIITVFFGFNETIVLKKYVVKSSEGLKGFKILQISDLHSELFDENQDEIVKFVNDEKPDIIVLTGDIGDDRYDIKGVSILLKNIKGKVPIYYVSGNHDIINSKYIHDTIKSFGVKYIENSSTEITYNGKTISIYGMSDPVELSRNNLGKPDDILESMDLNNDNYKILLSHRPELVNLYKKYEFNLIFSGHAHGGQVRIPYVINGLYAPNQGLFPQYAGGMYDISLNKILIVNRGLAINRLPRIFNPPELVLVTLD